MSHLTISDLIFAKLETLKNYQNPYVFTANTNNASEKDFTSATLEDSENNTPFLCEDTVCIQTNVLKNVEMKMFFKDIQKYLTIKASNQMFNPYVFENYIPPPPPLFAENEIIIFDDDNGSVK